MDNQTTKLRIKITRVKPDNYSSQANDFLRKIELSVFERVKRIIDIDILPLIIMPLVFLVFVGLEWWHWYKEIQTPFPILLTFIALGVSIYCYFKLTTHRK